MTLSHIRPAEDIPEFLRQGDKPRPMGQSTAEKWRHKTKDGTVVGVIITSRELTYKGRPAELVLARRETSGKARAAVTANSRSSRAGAVVGDGRLRGSAPRII